MPPARPTHCLVASLAVLAAALAALTVLAPTGAAQGQQPGFGGVVGDVSDTEHVVASGGPDEIRYRDSSSTGSLSSGDPVFLSQSTSVASADVRLANPRTSEVFTKVTSGDSDSGIDTTSLDGTLRYFDADQSGAFSPGDALYYDLSGSGDEKVSTRDLVLAGDGAGTLVASGHDRLGFGLVDLPTSASYGYYDKNDDGTQGSSEVSILDVDNDGYVSVGDVRLGSTDGGSGGTIGALGDADVTYVLEDFQDTWTFHHRDPDDDGSYDSNEPVFISTGSDVATFATRITNPIEGHSSGSQVIESHDDWGIPTEQVGGSLSYVDENGDGDFTAADTLYWDASNTASGEVARGDVILSGEEAGEVAGSGTGSVGDSLTSYSGTLRYLDADANDNYGGGGDTVYADTDDDGIVNADAVQLSDGKDPYAEDVTSPSITLTDPEDGASVVAGENVSIAGTAAPGDADLDTVEVDVDGTALDVTGLEDFNATWTAEGVGEHTVNATVTDADGETNTTSISLTVEEEPPEPPTVEIQTPTPETPIAAGSQAEIAGTATPGDADLDSVEVRVAGTSLDVTGLEDWSATWTPEEPGTYRVQVTATDADGVTGEASVEATVEEPEPPTITVEEPSERAEVPVNTLVNVSGSASPGTAELAEVTVTANGTSLDVTGTESWQTGWVPEGTGLQTVQATVVDANGLESSDSVVVNVTGGDGAEEGVPAPGPVLVVASVAALAVLARRRR